MDASSQAGSFQAGELAERFGLGLHGDAAARVHGVGTLAAAQPDQLAFLANPRYRGQLADTRASVVVMRPCRMSSVARFARIMLWWAGLPPNRAAFFGCGIVSSPWSGSAVRVGAVGKPV
ncbi:MAG: hypothetical protein KY442_08920 [Proteobacteria bacterium]|nr:hypothetical protein [Pseudomonadota bacterium]